MNSVEYSPDPLDVGWQPLAAGKDPGIHTPPEITEVPVVGKQTPPCAIWFELDTSTVQPAKRLLEPDTEINPRGRT